MSLYESSITKTNYMRDLYIAESLFLGNTPENIASKYGILPPRIIPILYKICAIVIECCKVSNTEVPHLDEFLVPNEKKKFNILLSRKYFWLDQIQLLKKKIKFKEEEIKQVKQDYDKNYTREEKRLRSIDMLEKILTGSTTKSVAQEYEISNERVRQVIFKLIRKMSHPGLIGSDMFPGFIYGKTVTEIRAQNDFWVKQLEKYKKASYY